MCNTMAIKKLQLYSRGCGQHRCMYDMTLKCLQTKCCHCVGDISAGCSHLLDLLQQAVGTFKKLLVVFSEVVALMEPVEGLLKVYSVIPGLCQAGMEPLHAYSRQLFQSPSAS